MAPKLHAELLVRGVRQALCLTGEKPHPDAPHDLGPLGLRDALCVAVAQGKIVALGTETEVLKSLELSASTRVLEAHGALLVPALLDAHTHSLFAGHRADEHALRLAGADYAELAKRGGGIARTVRAVRTSSDEELLGDLVARLRRMASHGVGTVEVKTGYGLELQQELRCVRVIREAAKLTGLRVPVTGLPLHAVPPELRELSQGRRRYLDLVRAEILPALLELGVDAVDAYLDGPGFSVAEARYALEPALRAGVPLRLHVGQFEAIGGGHFAAQHKALSVDHIEHLSDDELAPLADAGTVATLLPGAAMSLRQPLPKLERLRAAGLELAVATDCNPGTSYTENLPLVASLAVCLGGLSLPEAWWAITRAAAKALAMPELGALREGGPADFALLNLPDLGWA